MNTLEKSLTNITPSPEQVEKIEAAKELGKLLCAGPSNREQSLSITKLEESVMWAVKGILFG